MQPNKFDPDKDRSINKCFLSFTFDDGRYEQYSKFYPLLANYGLKATYYVTTERIGWKGVMGWDELKTLHNEGNEIGSHTHTHPHLTTLSDEDLDYEFKKSRDVLRAFNCTTLAYPFGEYDKRVVEQAKKYYTSARGYNPNIKSKNNAINTLNQESYKLNILPMEKKIPLEDYTSLHNCSLFELEFSNFKKTVKGLIKYAISRNAWIIFVIHGNYNRKNFSWFFQKPEEIIEHFFDRITRSSSIRYYIRKKAQMKDKMPKFKWMCEYISQNCQIEVLPVSQIIKKLTL